MVRGDQGLVRKCYKDNMKIKRKSVMIEGQTDHKVNVVDIDPRECPREDSLVPHEETKEVQIGSQLSEITHIGTQMVADEEAEVVDILRRNIDLFAWKPSDMPGIDPSIMCHHLALDPDVKPVS